MNNASITAPISIKLVAISYVFAGLVTLVVVGNPEFVQSWDPNHKVPTLWFYWMTISAICNVLAVPFLWKMKKWTAYFYLAVFVLGIAMAMVLWGKISTYDLAGLVPLFFIYINLEKMT